MDQTPIIRFNLDGVDVSRANGALTSFGEPAAGYTNYELYLIKTSPEYASKAVFYKNGVIVKSPF
jgi:hypothetical protein